MVRVAGLTSLMLRRFVVANAVILSSHLLLLVKLFFSQVRELYNFHH